MQNTNLKTRKRGFGAIEILIGATILTVSMLALLLSVQQMISATRRNENMVKATFLIEEGVEALRTIRDRGWTANIATLTASTTYYFAWSDTMWVATTTATTTDAQFTRTVVLQNVYRDTNSDIATNGTLDAGTRKFTVSVAWRKEGRVGTTTQSITGYITNLSND